MPEKDMRYVFPMAVVERMTGLTRRRIRYYEKCGLLKPFRTAGGHRLYSPSNVETLIRIKELIESGITGIEAISRMMTVGLPKPAQGRHAPFYSPAVLGDAAMRVMRPNPDTVIQSGKAQETDSPGYFRRKPSQ